MAKKAPLKHYFVKENDWGCIKKCWKNDIAFCIQPCYNESANYWVVRLKPSDYRSVLFLRIDTSIPDGKENRIKLSHYEATKKVCELYIEYSKKLI